MRKSLLVGAAYREHRYIHLEEDEDSWTDQRQIERWMKFVETWRRAATGNEAVLIGDF